MATANPAFRQFTLAEANSQATEEDQFRHIQVLGSGAFGTVFLALDRTKDDRRVAVKVISAGRGIGKMVSSLRSSLDEAKTLGALRHGNIVGFEKVYFSFLDEEMAICIVTEYCSGGSLDAYLRKHGRPTDRTMVKFYRQLATGMEYLHAQGFTHRNIKPDNILLDGMQNIKIADFGLAKAAWELSVVRSSSGVTLGGYMSTVAGTVVFIAPEVLDNHYTNAADVFSVALVYAAIAAPTKFTVRIESREAIAPACGTLPNLRPLGVLLHDTPTKRQLSACSRDLLGIDDTVRPPLRRLLDAMLVYDYHRRLSMADVLTRLEEMNSDPLPLVLSRAEKFEIKNKGCCN